VMANGVEYIKQSDHRSTFCSTVAADLSHGQGTYAVPTGVPTTFTYANSPTVAPTPTPATSGAAPAPAPAPAPITSSCTDVGGGTGSGLIGSYFSDQNLQTLSATVVDPTIGFDWNIQSPGHGLPADHFSIRWTGQIQPRMSGPWTFTVTADDGVRLWINNVLLINSWIDEAATNYAGTISLAGGTKYPVKLEYYDDTANAVIFMKWSHPCSTVPALPPAAQLYPVAATVAVLSDECVAYVGTGTGLSGKYYNYDTTTNVQSSLLGIRTDPINFHWTTSPIPGVNANGYRVQWTGYIQATVTGNYLFFTDSGNAVKLTVDNKVMIDDMTLHAPLADVSNTSIYLSSGSGYPISIDFINSNGDGVIVLYWSSGSCFDKTIVPASQLYVGVPPPPTADNFDSSSALLAPLFALVLLILAF